jgi:tetratricopeptide (TPR) repeat protein
LLLSVVTLQQVKATTSVISGVHTARRTLLRGDVSSALSVLDDLNAADFVTYHIVRAECLYAQHKYSDARSECETALRLSPNSPRITILLELIDEMLTLDRWVQPERKVIETKAVQDTQLEFPKMQRLEPPAPAATESSDEENAGLVSETLATLLAKQGKYAEARKIYIQLSRMHPARDAYFHERIAEMERLMQA